MKRSASYYRRARAAATPGRWAGAEAPGTRERPTGAPRADALPEHRTYRDTGCSYHPACLTCPFERCRYDTQPGIQVMQRQRRNPMVAARAREAGIDAAAAEFGLSRRSVFRIVREVGDG